MRLKQLLFVLPLLCIVAMAAGPQLTNVSVVSQGSTSVVTIQASGPFVFNPYRPADHLMLIDFPAVSPGKLADRNKRLQTPGLASYRVVGYTGKGGVEVARVELTLDPSAKVTMKEGNGSLTLNIIGAAPSVAANESQPSVAESKPVAQPVKAQAAPSRPQTGTGIARVSSITVARAAGGMEVEVAVTAPVVPSAMTLSNPERVVVDLPNAVPAGKPRPIRVNSGDVLAVRMGRFQTAPPVTRIVVDVRSPQSYQVAQNGNKVVLKLQPKTQVASQPASAEQKPAAVEQQKSAVAAATEKSEPVPPVPAPGDVSRDALVASVQPVALPSSTEASKKEQPAQNIAIVKPDFKVKATEEAPQQVAANVSAPAPMQETAPAPAQPAPQQTAAQPQKGTQAINFALEQRQLQSQGVADKPRYTGEPISVNLKDVDIKDFFRLIHEISGLNIVLDPSVSGTLTLVLDDVPWDQALDIVLRNNALDRQLEGNVLRIATVEGLRKEAEARRAQIQAQALAVDKVSVTRFLSYAHAKDVLPTIKKLLSVRGDVIADERTNALIIQDIPNTIPEIDRLLAQLDRKTQEVEIEARVVAATRTFARDIGTQLGFGWGNGPSAIGGALSKSPVEIGGLNPFYLRSPASNAIPLFTNMPALTPTSGLTFTNATNRYRIDAILTMAESRGLLKILSRPRIVTQNNIQAVVRQGVRLPVVTLGQLGGPPTVTFIDAFLRLTVTPQITVENTIFLNLDVENTSPDFAREVQGNPTLITQQATTQVLVTDGGTVVVGGVIQTQNNSTTEQVPLLGDIPILGNLFKRRSVETTTQELIFFITPKIIQT